MFSLTGHAGAQPPEIDSEITLEQFCEEQALSGGAEYPPPLYKDQPTAGLCGYNPLVGDQGRLIVENIRHEPDPFNPDEEEAMLEMDITALELPGLPSGQFEFRAEVTWRIECHRTHQVIREIVEDVELPYVGVHFATLFWDGKDANGVEVPAGVYPYMFEVKLIRTKIKGGAAGKTKIFDEVVSPWLFITLDRDNYYVDEDAAALLEHSIKDPLGAPNIPIKIVRSPVGTINMVYGEDFRVPLSSVGCNLGDDELNGLCFLSYFGSILGISDPAGDLEFSKVHPISAEHDLAVFKQLFHGWEVTGRHITLMVNKALEVTQIHSAAALPISVPEPQEIQAAFDAFDPAAGIDALREARSIPELEAVSLKEVIFTGLSGDTYIAIPAIEMTAHAPHPLDRHVLGVLDAATSSILTHEDLTADATYDDVLKTTVLFPGVTEDSVHPECSDNADCRAELGDNYDGEICSDHFTPNRCVRYCTSDNDCTRDDGTIWQCFLPFEATDLLGYCYFRDTWTPESEIVVYSNTADWGVQWFNEYLEDHDAFFNLSLEFPEIQQHHNDIGLQHSFDGKESPYIMRLFAIHTCDETTGRCQEYKSCPPGEVSGPQAGNIKMCADWRRNWATFEDTSYADDHPIRMGQRERISNREYIVGHEYGHLIQGAVHGSWGKGCLREGTATMFGSIFAANRRNLEQEEYSVPMCGSTSDPFRTANSGLSGPCLSGKGPMPYAYRSRFDWLDCTEEQWGETCETNDDCPVGEVCKHPDNYDKKSCTKTWTDIDCVDDHDCPPYNKCMELKDEDENVIGRLCKHWYDLYNSGPIMRRLMRIMALGPEPFYEEGHFEDLDIINRPLGINTTGKILAQTSPQLNHTTTMRHWMELMKKSASDHDTGDRQTFSATVDALGASGFFPRETVITGYKSNTAPTKLMFTSPRDGIERELTAWTTPNGFIRYQISEPEVGKCLSSVPLSDVDTRPAVVEHGNHVHIFWWDHTYQTIMVLLVPRTFTLCGEQYGPYPLGGIVRAPLAIPNGAMSAVSYKGRLYLVFGDKKNDFLSIAFCDHPMACNILDRWYDFGGGDHKQVIWNYPIQEGPSTVAASNVNGLPLDEEFLFIAYAARLQLGGGIGVLGMNSDHDIHSVYELSEYSPSFVTAKPLGLAVRTSAFPQKCDPGDIVPACPRNYLYLVWKHHEIPYQVSLSQPIYTAVLQNADPDEYWFTRPVKSLYSTRTGVSWTMGREPERNVEAVYIQPWTSRIVQFHGYGRY